MGSGGDIELGSDRLNGEEWGKANMGNLSNILDVSPSFSPLLSAASLEKEKGSAPPAWRQQSALVLRRLLWETYVDSPSSSLPSASTIARLREAYG